VAIIDPKGLFGGDRLRRCSNAAQLHWPRLFLASDGFARLEINYARIIGQAYPTFNPVPSETGLMAVIQEYVNHQLLFLYQAGGQLWGQWDTRPELLPRYKTASDKRSPTPPEPDFTDWKRCYRQEKQAFPKCFRNVPETFLYGVGVGVGENICASPSGNARVGDVPSIDTEPDALFPLEPTQPGKPARGGMTEGQERWFTIWWAEYWLHKGKKYGRIAFAKYVKTESRFQEVLAATRAQTPEMLARPKDKRPYPATWLNGERWEDEIADQQPQTKNDDYPEFDL
jgi:hypothetical protein